MIATLFVLTNLILRSTASDSINEIVNGNLIESWVFNFSMSVQDLHGYIFYCIDSDGYYTGIAVNQGKKNEKFVHVNYNEIDKLIPLKVLCGCDPCDETLVQFHLELKDKSIFFSCNHRLSEMFHVGNKKENVIDKNNNPRIPIDVAHRKNAIYILVGNNGPYTNLKGDTIFPSKSDGIGCLSSFFYNNKQITFKNVMPQTLQLCPVICNGSVCNDGYCQEAYKSITCNCSLASRNGLFCKKRLKPYIHGQQNTYDKVPMVDKVYMKISWKQFYYKKYCIAEIVLGTLQLPLWIDEGRLIANFTNFGPNNDDGFNFIAINITENNLIIYNKNEYSILHRNVVVKENIRINVGFSEKNNVCETFQGLYGVIYDSSLVQRKIIEELNETNATPKINDGTTSYQNNKNVIVTVASASPFVICALIVAIVSCFCAKKKRINRRRHMLAAAQLEFCEQNPITIAKNRPCPEDIDLNRLDTASTTEVQVQQSTLPRREYSSNDTLPPVPQSPHQIND